MSHSWPCLVEQNWNDQILCPSLPAKMVAPFPSVSIMLEIAARNLEQLGQRLKDFVNRFQV